MTAPESQLRWYRLTPDRLILALLPVEGLLWLSERFQWFGFNQHKGWTVLIAVAGIGVFLLFMLLWFVAALLFRLRFQYSIRSLLVLTLAVAVPCSWFATQRERARKQRAAVEAIKAIGADVRYDYHFVPGGQVWPMEDTVDPGWLRSLVGSDFLHTFVAVDLVGPGHDDRDLVHIRGQSQLQWLNLNQSDVTDDGFATLKELKNLWSLSLGYTRIGDTSLIYVGEMTKLEYLQLSDTNVSSAGLKHLARLTRLKHLDLACGQVSDVGVSYLEGLTQLKFLRLDCSKVTDAGLEHVRKLAKLEQLRLQGTQITDRGLEHLKGLKHLRWLYVPYTQVTDAGVRRLQQSLPNCKIDH